jgi:ribosomal protein L11 methyltransferase
MADYLSLTVELPEESSELLQSMLDDLGALGLEVRDAEAPPMPGVRGPAKGEAIVIAWFEARADADAALRQVEADFPAARAKVDAVPERDWSTEWRALIRSVQVGSLWVGPPWETPAPGKVAIVIEPKMAFGTGDHPTTSLCLAAVDDFLGDHPGCSVLDVGTGTGVLAIAAKKLGANRVIGVDSDAMSVQLARENAQTNHTPEVQLSGDTLDKISGRFDLVLANILANTLVELAPAIAPKVGARLVLAGVLVHQKDEVVEAYRAQRLVPSGERVQGEWIRLDFDRP